VLIAKQEVEGVEYVIEGRVSDNAELFHIGS